MEPTLALVVNVAVSAKGQYLVPSKKLNEMVSPSLFAYSVIRNSGSPTYGPKGGTDVDSCTPRTSVPEKADSVPEENAMPSLVTSAVMLIVFWKSALLKGGGGTGGGTSGDGALRDGTAGGGSSGRGGCSGNGAAGGLS